MTFVWWWIGTLIVVFGVSYVVAYSFSTASQDIRYGHGIMRGAYATSVIMIILFFVMWVWSSLDCHPDYFTLKEQSLVAVKNSDGIVGSFIFGTGGFGTTNKYRVYAKRAKRWSTDEAVYQHEYDASNTGIVEDVEPDKAYVEATYSIDYPGNSFARHYVNTSCACMPKVVRRVIHVPKGTVIGEFKIE